MRAPTRDFTGDINCVVDKCILHGPIVTGGVKVSTYLLRTYCHWRDEGLNIFVEINSLTL